MPWGFGSLEARVSRARDGRLRDAQPRRAAAERIQIRRCARVRRPPISRCIWPTPRTSPRKWCSCTRPPAGATGRGGIDPSTFRPSSSTASRSRNREFKEFIDARRLRTSRALARFAVRRWCRRLAGGRREVRRHDRSPGTGDVGSGHVPRWHRRPPGRRRELVRSRRVCAIPRQGAADRLSLVPRRDVAERAARIACHCDDRLQAISPDEGTAPVGEHGGIGPFGTYDMAGNVREWLWNVSPDGRWIGRRRVEPGAVPLQRARRGAALGPLARKRLSLHAHAARTRLRRGTARADRAEVGRFRGARAGRGRCLRGARAAARILIRRSGPHVSSHSSRRTRSGLRERITLATGYDDSRFADAAVPADRGHAAVPGSDLRAACRLYDATRRVEPASSRPIPRNRSTSSSSPGVR